MQSFNKFHFPKEFLWGVATSAYQIEGAVNEEGRGESIWDRFSAMPGKIQNGETATIACDHYHRYKEDVAIIRELGVDAYRFSISWPRILPQGQGVVNKAGLDFYDRLVDELLANHIKPFATLYHWDLPQALEEQGGWLNRNCVHAFCEYTQHVVARLGDRVKNWITINEPSSVAKSGYEDGKLAPGKSGLENGLAAAHHILLAHGTAIPYIRQLSPGAEVGIAMNINCVYPASDHPVDAKAAFVIYGRGNRWYLEPLFLGIYPEDILSTVQSKMPFMKDTDLPTIATPIDFLGINHYTVYYINVVGKGYAKTRHLTDMGWEVYPKGLYDILLRINLLYRPKKIYITENGAAFPDKQHPDGTVHDLERQRYLESYIEACSDAIKAKVPLSGYFVWSLLDNFEWTHGFGKRFGIIHVDFSTLKRTPKYSALWYKEFIKSQKI